MSFNSYVTHKLLSTRNRNRNRNPERKTRKRSRNEGERSEDWRSGSTSSRHNSPLRKCCSKSKSHSDSPDHTPSWAKKLLEAHKKSEEQFQLLEKELKTRLAADERSRVKSPQPDFNKKEIKSNMS